MKKTIATALLIAESISVQAKPYMNTGSEYSTMCVSQRKLADSSVSLGFCDQSENNKKMKLKLAENGCAEGQAAIRILKSQVLRACLPAGVAQL